MEGKAAEPPQLYCSSLYFLARKIISQTDSKYQLQLTNMNTETTLSKDRWYDYKPA